MFSFDIMFHPITSYDLYMCLNILCLCAEKEETKDDSESNTEIKTNKLANRQSNRHTEETLAEIQEMSEGESDGGEISRSDVDWSMEDESSDSEPELHPKQSKPSTQGRSLKFFFCLFIFGN